MGVARCLPERRGTGSEEGVRDSHEGGYSFIPLKCIDVRRGDQVDREGKVGRGVGSQLEEDDTPKQGTHRQGKCKAGFR